MQIESGQVVTLRYTATDAEGRVLERDDRPVTYLHGYENFIDKLEEGLAGLSMGESFELAVEDAYGPAATSEPIAVPRKELPKQWRLEPGFVFTAPGSAGATATLFVHSVRGSRVFVSPSHPWGGRKVTFKGEILHLRGSTMEERQHKHVHGPGGHHH